MGFYAKGMDGRIDDPAAGWKGKGIWTTYATRAPFHAEGGKGTTSLMALAGQAWAAACAASSGSTQRTRARRESRAKETEMRMRYSLDRVR